MQLRKMTEVEQRMTDDLEWAEHAPEVQENPDHYGKSVVVYNKQILAVGKDSQALLEQAAMASRPWECRNGYHDSDGLGAGERSEFALFPLAKKRSRGMSWPIREGRLPSHGFWFLFVDGEARLCVSEDGKLWDRDCNEADLVPAYAQRRRIWPLVTETAASVLP